MTNPMPRRFSKNIVHRNGTAMLLEVQIACETPRDRIFVVGSGGDAGSSGQLAAAYTLVQHICNLLP